METDFHVTVKGLEPRLAQRVGSAVFAAVQALEASGDGLDFRRMHRLIVALDYPAELAELSALTASGNPIPYTNEEYALGVAKVLTLPAPDGQREILPVVDARIALSLAPEDDSEADVESIRYVLHLLHHEFVHVHDTNKQIDAFEERLFTPIPGGKDALIRPLAKSLWDEYCANRLSAASATDENVQGMVDSLENAILRTKPQLDAAILAYRESADLPSLMADLGRHGEYLVRSAAYVLGYVDGLDTTLADLSPDAQAALVGSYFQPTHEALHHELRALAETYPAGWDCLDVFDGLAGVVEQYFSTLGFDLETTSDQQMYVSIPYRPETMPDS